MRDRAKEFDYFLDLYYADVCRSAERCDVCGCKLPQVLTLAGVIDHFELWPVGHAVSAAGAA